MRPPTALRLVPLVTAAALLALLGLVIPLDRAGTDVPIVWLALPFILGLADLFLVPAVGSTARPLPHGLPRADADRIATGVLGTVTWLRYGLAVAPALFGLAAALVTRSVLPYLIGIAFAVPVLMLAVYPSERVVRSVRMRLESDPARPVSRS
jgi:hypothetical protein